MKTVGIIGLGATGLSVARYLHALNQSFVIMDSRENPPERATLNTEMPEIDCRFGPFDPEFMSQFDELILSPGVMRREPAVAACIAKGMSVVGDIELFARVAKAPIIGITGTNGKSTVTALTADLIRASGFRVEMGGNIGEPALNLLKQPVPDFYVLELSSYQLESCPSLKMVAGALLNITPDHLNSYPTYLDYQKAKWKIFEYSERLIANQDDPLTWPKQPMPTTFFTLKAPGAGEFGIITSNKAKYLSFGSEKLLPTTELPLFGQHNWANILAAMGLAHAIQCDVFAICEAVKAFQGLEHRCQTVRRLQDVTWINDSKGTNVGASIAALTGIGGDMLGKIVLIAGGQGKDADFTDLYEPVKEYVRCLVLFGEDAHKIEAALTGAVPITRTTNMQQAVACANECAKPGDVVLLSPACASFDQYKNFMERGDDFKRWVEAL